jgi:hypothetical protein
LVGWSDGLARHNLYLDRIEKTVQVRQISSIIEDFREEVRQRPLVPSRTERSRTLSRSLE